MCYVIGLDGVEVVKERLRKGFKPIFRREDQSKRVCA